MSSSIQKAVKIFRRSPILFLRLVFTTAYNSIFARTSDTQEVTDSPVLNEIILHARQRRTDISDHLVPLFIEGIQSHPNLIVELGVRGGESTFVFERVSRLTNAKLVSVDIEDCSNSSSYENWVFVQMDDITFANQFDAWCSRHQIAPVIDLLFIDTSHEYEHTVQELQHWLPFTSPQAKVVFHDTNMRHIYHRKDGSLGVTRLQHRGVIAALEDYFHKSFNERSDFIDYQDGWIIKHYANSSGFTILEKMSGLQG